MPRSWAYPNRKLSWDSGKELFETFYARVKAYGENNSLPVPSPEELEDYLCRQSAGRECTGSENYHASPRNQPMVKRSGAAKKCCGQK